MIQAEATDAISSPGNSLSKGVSAALILGVMALSAGFTFAGADNSQSPHMKAANSFAQSGIVNQKNCITCHTIGNSGGTVGPNLNQISNRRSQYWLRKWFKDPNSIKPGTKMPNFQFTDNEIDELLRFVAKMKRDIPAQKILSESSNEIEAGERLFEEYDCFACHRIGKTGRFVGPNLTWVGRRKSREWETIWLQDPSASKPGTFMPNFHLQADEIQALTAFLHSLQGQENESARKWESMTSFILDARPRERGRLVANRVACWSCHGEGLAGGVKNPNAAPDETVPAINESYLDFSDDELKEIILRGRKAQKLSADGPEPLFACPPWHDALSAAELDDLLAYLQSIAPESSKWEFQ